MTTYATCQLCGEHTVCAHVGMHGEYLLCALCAIPEMAIVIAQFRRPGQAMPASYCPAPSLSRSEALAWYRAVPNGIDADFDAWQVRFGVERMTDLVKEDVRFTLGVETGIRIALARVYGLTLDEVTDEPGYAQRYAAWARRRSDT